MRNTDPHRENVENILAICLPILTMQHIRESPSASHAMRMNGWNATLSKGDSLGMVCLNTRFFTLQHMYTLYAVT